MQTLEHLGYPSLNNVLTSLSVFHHLLQASIPGKRDPLHPFSPTAALHHTFCMSVPTLGQVQGDILTPSEGAIAVGYCGGRRLVQSGGVWREVPADGWCWFPGGGAAEHNRCGSIRKVAFRIVYLSFQLRYSYKIGRVTLIKR